MAASVLAVWLVAVTAAPTVLWVAVPVAAGASAASAPACIAHAAASRVAVAQNFLTFTFSLLVILSDR